MRFTRTVASALSLALAVFLSPGLAHGQYEAGQWRATPIFGVNTYDSATPFKTAGVLGGTIQYSFSDAISLGIGVGYSRPEVDGSYYDLTLFQISPDTLILNQAGWQASQWTYYALVTAGIPLSNLYIYAQGGAGGVTFWWDAQSFRDTNIRTGETNASFLMIPLGAGISYSVTSLIGVRIDAVDEIYTKFDRDPLNPARDPRFQNNCSVEDFCILEANGTPPEAKTTVHNFRFSIGFEFTPGR